VETSTGDTENTTASNIV